MAKNKEFELAIKIAGEVEKSFYESTRLTKKQIEDIAEQAAMATAASKAMGGAASKYAASVMDSFRKGIGDAGPLFDGLETAAKETFNVISKAAMASGAAIAAGLVASVHVGSEFESAFAGVEKTVSASNIELMQMRDNIREMAQNDIPMSAAELSGIAESAGQLGIHNESIISFTGTMANMSVATDLSSDDAASEFAKFANITEMSQEYFSNLGSSVVALGNNMATTESDTVSMAMRIAAAGHQVKLSEADIMAYSAALSSVGIEADAGGTAFSKLLANLQMAVETGDNLKDYASVAGMTGEEFKQAFKDDATVAINAFLAGLNNTERNGKSAIAVLDEMGLTEVRLRDTLLRAGNASGMFTDALEISNKAWEENTALANEAEQRYKTFEMQCQMTKNKISDIGISIYDDLRPGLTEGIMLANEFVGSLAGKEDILGDTIESATKSMPTLVRRVREAGESVKEFSEPFLEVGEFLVDNPGIIVGTISGVGSALAAYKIASSVASITSALTALTPAGKAILGIGTVAGIIVGIGTSVKKAAAEAKRANLDAHFGNIALSLSELQAVASDVVRSQELDKVRESIAAMSEADGIADDIKSATAEINKMNWKVSIGMELTESEQESYREQIESYISSTQDYLTEHQYAVNLAVGVLTDDDLEGTNIVTKVNQFYQGQMDELARLGAEMRDTINDAFKDGILDDFEIEAITNLQSQMAEIQNTITGTEYDANLELLKSKYSFGDLDAESFRNFQSELLEQTEAASADYEKAFIKASSNARAMLRNGNITQDEYDNTVDEFQRNYKENVGNLKAKAAILQVHTIKEQYYDEIGSIDMDEKAREGLDYMFRQIDRYQDTHLALNERGIHTAINLGLDKSTQAAISELWEEISPQFEELTREAEECREAGRAIPGYISEGINDAAAIGALVGDKNALYTLMGKQVNDSPEYRDMLESFRDQGFDIPEQIAEGILSNKQIILDAMKDVMQGIANVGSIQVTNASSTISQLAVSAVPHADGGIFDKPHLAWIAEAGYKEAAIPIDGSKNAIDLWLKTGELLGMDGLTGGAAPMARDIEEAVSSGTGTIEVHIEHKPVLQFQEGIPSKEDIEDALESSYEKFDRYMQEWLAQNRRLKFV